MQIHEGRLDHPAVQALLSMHLDAMHGLSPPESVHALGVAKLRTPDITFWTAWDGDALMGCAALRRIDDSQGELKSMRTAPACRRRGVGAALLRHVVAEARSRGYTRLSLETGTAAAFEPAQRLYARAGFRPCGPFGEYREDPHSLFMTMDLADVARA